MLPAVAAAAPQTSAQQRCVNDLNKAGARLARTQNRTNLRCLQDASAGLLSRLGVPPQAQTAQACLTNDVGERVAKDAAKVQTRDARSCLADPEQMPGFGYAGARRRRGCRRGRRVWRSCPGLFGPNLDAAVIPTTAIATARGCQADVLHETTDLFYAIWKVALDRQAERPQGHEPR